jgi:hypothetical protein
VREPSKEGLPPFFRQTLVKLLCGKPHTLSAHQTKLIILMHFVLTQLAKRSLILIQVPKMPRILTQLPIKPINPKRAKFSPKLRLKNQMGLD